MDSIKFIYFDIGGVLVDWTRAFTGAANKFNLNSEDIGIVFDQNHDDITKGLISAKDLWKECIQKYNLKNASDFNFLESWVSDYRPIKQAHKFLEKLKPRYKVGLLSNIYKDMLPLLLETRVIPNIHYDQLVLSCDVGMMKPNLSIYKLSQNKANLNAQNILFVDDREDFLLEPKKMNWHTFLYDPKNPDKSTKELTKYLKITF